MSAPNILIIPGSTRDGSFSTKLAYAIAKQLNKQGAEAETLSLKDYPLPLFNQDDETQNGAPESARELAKKLEQAQGVVLVHPEYNGSLTPLMKNMLDWLSRDVGVKVYQNRTFALAACSPGGLGGIRVLSHARDILVSVGADTITPQLAVGGVGSAISEDGDLTNERAASLLQNLCTTLIDRAKTYL